MEEHGPPRLSTDMIPPASSPSRKAHWFFPNSLPCRDRSHKFLSQGTPGGPGSCPGWTYQLPHADQFRRRPGHPAQWRHDPGVRCPPGRATLQIPGGTRHPAGLGHRRLVPWSAPGTGRETPPPPLFPFAPPPALRPLRARLSYARSRSVEYRDHLRPQTSLSETTSWEGGGWRPCGVGRVCLVTVPLARGE